MNCNLIQELISPYMDDELSLDGCHAFESHIMTCTDCQNLLNEWNRMGESVRSIFEDIAAPIDLEEQVIQSIEVERQESQVHRLSILYFTLALFSVGSIAALAISPLGVVIRAIIHLLLTMMRGGLYMSQSMEPLWYAVIVVFCISLSGLSLVGLFRILRFTQREEVI